MRPDVWILALLTFVVLTEAKEAKPAEKTEDKKAEKVAKESKSAEKQKEEVLEKYKAAMKKKDELFDKDEEMKKLDAIIQSLENAKGKEEKAKLQRAVDYLEKIEHDRKNGRQIRRYQEALAEETEGNMPADTSLLSPGSLGFLLLLGATVAWFTFLAKRSQEMHRRIVQTDQSMLG